MQRIHQLVQFKPEILVSPSVIPISEDGSGMPYRTLEGFSIISALFKTYYAMFFLVFATQYFVLLSSSAGLISALMQHSGDSNHTHYTKG
jgi:hypothetical protein